eukprot:GDKI01025411.1.p1 GENE.GDKI01025411.1~~GDKI01025411.1.p1  ORF type:complete len:234 (-),score=76.96 GDKI01025411.1:165-800(-)
MGVDFTATIAEDGCRIIRIPRDVYLLAVKATSVNAPLALPAMPGDGSNFMIQPEGSPSVQVIGAVCPDTAARLDVRRYTLTNQNSIDLNGHADEKSNAHTHNKVAPQDNKPIPRLAPPPALHGKAANTSSSFSVLVPVDRAIHQDSPGKSNGLGLHAHEESTADLSGEVRVNGLLSQDDDDTSTYHQSVAGQPLVMGNAHTHTKDSPWAFS